MDRSQAEAEEQRRLRAPDPTTADEWTITTGPPTDERRPWERMDGFVGSLGTSLGSITAQGTLEQELASELDAVRQRLAYYERFDSLINDSVQRSADLFQALFTEREAQRRASTTMFSEVSAAVYAESEQLMADERSEMNATLMGLMTEASRLQRQIDGLIQQIAEAVTAVSTRGAPHDGPTTGA